MDKVCDTVQETGIKAIPKKKKWKKPKWLSEKALQIAVNRREAKGKGEKERYVRLSAEFLRIARRDEKAFHFNFGAVKIYTLGFDCVGGQHP